MRIDSSGGGAMPAAVAPAASTSISEWVNEPLPALNHILTAHDAARLTRRPCWLLVGLSLLGQFPKKMRFRGKQIGWRHSDVLDWLSRDHSSEQTAQPSKRLCARHVKRQTCQAPGFTRRGPRTIRK
jgi:hypothetical protein